MRDSSPSTIKAIGSLSYLFFIALLVLGILMSKSQPIPVLVGAVIIVLLGVCALVFGLVQWKRINPIYDYEPMVLWGRNTNGKGIRELFTAIISIGLWMGLAGLAIACVSMLYLLPKD